jgi:hypothetical protein
MYSLHTVWIHRSNACDLLVHFHSPQRAYSFCIDMLEEYGDDSTMTYDWDYKYSTEGYFEVGCSLDLQLSIHQGAFHHSGWKGITGWNVSGTALVDKDEAMDLGNHGDPVGFIPEESEEGIWVREKRTHEDLDEDLHDYFRLGEIEEMYVRNE